MTTVASSSHDTRSSFIAQPLRMGLPDTFSDEAPADYVLHYGFQGDRVACKQQDDAYFALQRKVVTRQDSAQALLLSANVLSMSVMASQLTMYRWKVTESQTVSDATTQVQDMINSATRCGYQVKREAPKPLKLSKYADGEGLKRLYEKNMAKLERRRERRAAAAAASGKNVAAAVIDDDADALYNTLLKSSGSSSSSESDGDDDNQSKHAHGHAHHRHGKHTRSGSSSASSVCSADLAGPSDGRRKLPPAPPDAIPRLVLVDRFTHESFTDIAHNLRHLDERFGLQLVIVLLMSEDNDAATIQGAGTVVVPQHDITVESAYAAGYDLVLRHHFDHTVVNFLSNIFVTSAGRWRGDVRAKAAVGNYLSLKNVLLGRIDTEALQQLVWKESVDDAEILQQLGDHTLALHGEAKRYGAAGQKLNMQAVGVSQGRKRADVLTLDTPEDVPLEEALAGTGVLAGLPHLWAGKAAMQVSSAGGVRTTNAQSFLPLEGLTITNDELQQCMDPSDRIKHSVKQLRQSKNPQDEKSYDYVLVDEKDENRALLMTAIEEEMTRLLAENETKTTAMRHLQEDVSRLQRTVEVLRRQRVSGASGGGGGGSSFDGGSIGGADLGPPGRRPDSGSLVNLTKEQQIYVLKERLDQANDQIVALLDGTGRMRPNSGARRAGSAGQRAGRNGTGSRGGSRGAGGSRRTAGQERGRLQAYQRYQEHRETEFMTFQDEDALWKATRIDEVPGLGVGMQSGGDVSSPRRGTDPAEIATQRREREATHGVVLQLQEELTQMHARAGTGSPNGSARLIHRVEEALKRLEAQNARIAQLEELRRMDDAFFQAELKRVKQRAEDSKRESAAAAASTRAESGGKKKKTKVKAGGGPAPRRPAARGDADDADNGDGGKPGSAQRPPLSRKKGDGEGAGVSAEAHALALKVALDDAKVEHEAHLHALSVKFTRDQRVRESALRARLDRLYHHIRQPHTAAYAGLLEEQRAFAEAHAKDVRHRLEFALSHLKAHQLAPGAADSASVGVLTRIADPVTREKIEQLATEYAQHAAQAAEAQRRLEALRPELDAENVQTHVQQLVAQRQASQAAVTEAGARPGGSLEDYLAAVEARQAVDQQLALWADVDVQSVLREYASLSHGAKATGTAPPALVAVSTTVPTSLQAGAQPITVAGLELREVAEAYRVATLDTSGLDRVGSSGKKKGRKPRSASSDARKAGAKGRRPRSLSSDSPRPGSGRDSGSGLSAAAHGHARPGSRGSSGSGSRLGSAGRRHDTSHEDDDADTASPRSTREDREEPHAVIDAFAGHGAETVAALEAGVARGLLSRTQQRWYGLLLDRYERGYIHPDRMIDLDSVATTSAMTASSGAVEAADKDGESETARARRLYLSVHRELQRLLLTLTTHFPALMPLVAVCTPRVEAGLAEELLNDNTTPCIAPVFLAAADAARLTWIIDYLGTVLTDVHNRAAEVKKQARLSTSEDEAVVAMVRAVAAQQSCYHSHPSDPLIVSYVASYRAAAAEYEEGEGGWWASPAQAHDAVNPYQEPSPPEAPLGGIEAYLNAKRAELGVDPEALGYTPDDLAALFSRKKKDQDELANLLPPDLYEALEAEGDPAYAEMMHGIRGELEYLNALKQQRMEELVLQYRLRQRKNADREKNVYGGLGPGDEGGDPYAGRAVPEFEVKEGAPAWYGMEAARRVKDILRRKRKPDQIVVDGGPAGGSVGIELSRRTAFPRPASHDIIIAQTAQDRLRAARTAALPPLKRAGMSRQQQQRLAESGYNPRDVSNYNAFHRVLAHAEFDGVSHYQPSETPAEMTARLIQYRAAISRAASRLGGGTRVGGGLGDAWVAQQLGVPYYLPIATADGRVAAASGVSSSSAGATPTLTTWTYGLPTEQLEQLLTEPVDADGHNATTTVVLPHENNSRLAREATTANPRRAASRQQRGQGTGLGAANNNNNNAGYGFMSGAIAYTSPAALAAQRLSTMLHMSMEDPTVAALARMTEAGPAGGSSSSTAPQYADLAQLRRASRYADHRRSSQAPPQPQPPHAPSEAASRHLSPSPPPSRGGRLS